MSRAEPSSPQAPPDPRSSLVHTAPSPASDDTELLEAETGPILGEVLVVMAIGLAFSAALIYGCWLAFLLLDA